jgi:hypothetical protein
MVRLVALCTDSVRLLQNGGLDANGQPCERSISTGKGTPCRHCLRQIDKGEEYLILSFRPFPTLQPYAEQGPIFLHASECGKGDCSGDIPTMLENPQYIVRGYDANDRIVYGTGSVTPTSRIQGYAAELFMNPNIAYLHVRSAANNCYQCRIDRE